MLAFLDLSRSPRYPPKKKNKKKRTTKKKKNDLQTQQAPNPPNRPTPRQPRRVRVPRPPPGGRWQRVAARCGDRAQDLATCVEVLGARCGVFCFSVRVCWCFFFFFSDLWCFLWLYVFCVFWFLFRRFCYQHFCVALLVFSLFVDCFLCFNLCLLQVFHYLCLVVFRYCFGGCSKPKASGSRKEHEKTHWKNHTFQNTHVHPSKGSLGFEAATTFCGFFIIVGFGCLEQID